jgi:hypothetical protein
MQVSLAPKIKEFEGRIGLAARICYLIHSTGFTLQIMHNFLCALAAVITNCMKNIF